MCNKPIDVEYLSEIIKKNDNCKIDGNSICTNDCQFWNECFGMKSNEEYQKMMSEYQ